MNDPEKPYRESWGSLLLRMLRNALLTAVGLGVAAAIVSWLIGWRTLFLMGQGQLFAGVLSIALGLLSTLGTWNIRGSFQYQFSRSASHERPGERATQDLHDLFGSNAFMVTTLVAGVILILVGSLLQRLSG